MSMSQSEFRKRYPYVVLKESRYGHLILRNNILDTLVINQGPDSVYANAAIGFRKTRETKVAPEAAVQRSYSQPYIKGDEGAFHSVEDHRKKSRRHKMMFTDLEGHDSDEDSSELGEFEPDPDDAPMGEALSHTQSLKDLFRAKVKDTSFHGIEQHSWEDGIVWSSSDNEDTFVAPRLSGYRNPVLQTAEWEEAILWDDEEDVSASSESESGNDTAFDFDMPDRPKRRKRRRILRKRAPLILDPNDPRMIFELEAERERKVLFGDPFKLASNDRFYQDRDGVRQFVKVRHATPAAALCSKWYPTNLSQDQKIHFHRPRLHVKTSSNVRQGGLIMFSSTSDYELENLDIVPITPNRKQNVRVFNEHDAKLYDVPYEHHRAKDKAMFPRSEHQLTNAHGDIVVMEYVEEHPLFVMNNGMASNLSVYMREKNLSGNADEEESEALRKFMEDTRDGEVDDFTVYRQEHGDFALDSVCTNALSYGQKKLLSESDPSPFEFGDIPAGGHQPIRVLANEMFTAPVFPHWSGFHDFLLVRSSVNPDDWFIREICNAFTVGQLQPKMQVYAPQSQINKDQIQDRVKVFVNRLVNAKLDLGRGFTLENITSAFPATPIYETIIQRIARQTFLKTTTNDVALKENLGEQPTELENQNLCTPEKVCKIERTEAARARMFSMGLQFADELSVTQLTKIIPQLTDPDTKKAALFLEHLLQLTPWHITREYIDCVCGIKEMVLDSAINPLFVDGLGFSYVHSMDFKTKEKRKNDKHEKAAELKAEQEANEEVDIKFYSQEEIRKFIGLLTQEHSYNDLSAMNKSDLLKLFNSHLLSYMIANRPVPWELQKFVKRRHVGKSVASQIYGRKLDAIMERQIRALSNTEVQAYDLSDDDAGSEDEKALPPVQPNVLVRQSSSDIADLKYALERRAQARMATKRPLNTPFKDEKTGKMMIRRMRKVRAVRRVLKVTNADGTVTEKETIIKDGKTIERFMDSQSTGAMFQMPGDADLFAAKTKKRKTATKSVKSKAAADERAKKRAEDKKARNLVKLQQKALTNPHITCKRCGMKGHNKSNNMCPLKEKLGKSKEAKANLIRVRDKAGEGSFTLSVSTKDINARAEEERAHERKIRAALTKGQRGPKKKPEGLLRRTRGDPRVQMESLLTNVMEHVDKVDKNHAFERPVNAKYVADYYSIIKNPISGQKIKEKIKKKEYHTADAFLADLTLLYDNCVKYNGLLNPLSTVAKQMLTTAQNLVKGSSEIFTNVEADIAEVRRLELLSSMLRKVTDPVYKDKKYFEFKTPVDTKKVPLYRKVIAKPMCISTIRKKVNINQYLSVPAFFDDFSLIYLNCLKFNGPNHRLTLLAKEVMEMAWATLTELGLDLSNIEHPLSRTPTMTGAAVTQYQNVVPSQTPPVPQFAASSPPASIGDVSDASIAAAQNATLQSKPDMLQAMDTTSLLDGPPQ